MPIHVRPYRPGDGPGVIDVILPIQRDEFNFAITAEEQPDLSAIPDFYQSGAGGFWVAEQGGRLVGTIGLRDIGERQAALRKMFVAAPVRGREHGVGASLLATLLAHARDMQLREVFLGTTDRFLAAHRFYEKNGFVAIEAALLPERFPRMAVDNAFYRYRLAP
jgi:N-acetylglutamate synthase-like GNAT family acetyltransferase